MTIKLRKSTASQEVPLGYFVDSTDGNTEKTALTIANTDIKVWKNGATSLANKNSGGATHMANGVYYAVLDATDTDTLGPLVLFVHVATSLAVRLECEVVDAAVFDAASIWDEPVDGATTARESLRLHNAAMGGKASGLGTTTAVYRDLADTKDRISATVDADGNRTAVTRVLT